MAKKKPAKPNQHGLGDAPESWTWYAGGRLCGCALARERHRILAWSEGNAVYLFDLFGELLAERRFDKEVVAIAAADNGAAYAVLARSGGLWWLDGELDVCFQVPFAFDGRTVALDAHGYYAAVVGAGGQVAVVGRDGTKVSQFETRPPLKFISFLANEGQLVGAGDHGLLGCYDLVGRVYWEAHPFSNTGGFATDATGETFLLASYGHGLVRFGNEGAKEGTYRTEGSPAHVAMDFVARRILTSTLEKTVVELTYEGAVVASRSLPDAPVGLCLDALGRYLVVALPSGELRFATLQAFFRGEEDAAEAQPTWRAALAGSNEEAESAVLAPIGVAGGVAAFTNRRTVRVFDAKGEALHETAGVSGVGRALAVGPGWFAAYTDGRLVCYDTSDNTSVVSTAPLFEISHLEPFGQFGNLLVVQSCEYVSRLFLPETEVYRERLDRKVESAAVQTDGSAAFALDDGTVRIYDPMGKLAGRYRPKPEEPLLVVRGGDGWTTLGRQSRWIRGLERDGKLLWSFEAPWAVWSMQTIGDRLVVTGVDGSSLLATSDGEVLQENRDPRQHAHYFRTKEGSVGRIFAVGSTLVATEFSGKAIGRWGFDGKLGAFTADDFGVWAVVDRQLHCWTW